MRCGLDKEEHWEKDGLLYLNSPMYHCEDRCPYQVGDCIRNCNSLTVHQRLCLSNGTSIETAKSLFSSNVFRKFGGRMIRIKRSTNR